MDLRKIVVVCVGGIVWLLSQCAAAEIVHTVSEAGSNSGLIDLDRDGSFDLGILSTIRFGEPGGTLYSLSLARPQWNKSPHAILSRNADGIIAQLTGGETIGPDVTEPWQWIELAADGAPISSRYSLPWTDSWSTQPIGLLGVRLQREQDVHFGWIRIDLSGNDDHLHYHAKVIDFAYESTPNTPIVAGAVPEPASWALAAAGLIAAAALYVTRRRA